MFVRQIICILSILVTGGCTYFLRYKLDNTSVAESPIKALRIAVAPFSNEKKEKSNSLVGNSLLFELTKKEREEIASIITEHFEHVNLFAYQKKVEKEFTNPSSEQLFRLKKDGYDAILTGTIIHASGFQYDSGSGAAQTLSAVGGFVPIFYGVAAAVDVSQETTYGGKMLMFVKIIETSSGRVIWEGNALGSVCKKKKKGMLGWPLVEGFQESFKASVVSLVEQLKNASF